MCEMLTSGSSQSGHSHSLPSGKVSGVIKLSSAGSSGQFSLGKAMRSRLVRKARLGTAGHWNCGNWS